MECVLMFYVAAVVYITTTLMVNSGDAFPMRTQEIRNATNENKSKIGGTFRKTRS